ncbi:MAG: hypothetical protein PHP42_01845 [Bacteroidota bacterium]|nr:hypothetical protein [Bacteroidota bacterium]
MKMKIRWENFKNNFLVTWERIVEVPVSNEEEARLGRLFNVLMVISFFITVSLTISFVLMKPLGYIETSVNLIAAMFPFIFIPFSLFCLLWSKRGNIRPATKLYVWANFAAISMAAWIFDGVHSPAWQLYMWTITIAGILLAPAYALWMTGGIVLYFFIIAGLSFFGMYSSPLTLTAAGNEYLTIVFRLIMFVSTIGVLTYLNMCSLRDALKRLRVMMKELSNINEKLHRENAERRKVEAEREKLICELQESLTNIKTLSGLLPICASCKKIRDDKGYWNQVEKYLTEHTEVQLTHGMCPECFKKFYPDIKMKPDNG